MIELIWSPQSVADIEEIRAHIARDSQLYADLTVRRIIASVERLRAFPDIGRVVPERRLPELREVIAGNFRIVYRRTATTVEVATVFRGAREFSHIE